MKLKHYEVRASMSVILRTRVVATSANDAIAQAKELVDSGLMDELPNSGAIIDWEVFALPRKSINEEVPA